MLPFMREQGFGESPANNMKNASAASLAFKGGKAADSNGVEKQLKTQNLKLKTPDPAPEKLGAGQEYLTVAVHSKSVRKTTLLLAVLFGIGLLCLWFMIKKSAPSTAAAVVGVEETQFEKAIAQLIGVKSEMFSRMDDIVKKFYEFSDVQQVKVGELVKNPFKLEIFLGNIKKNTAQKDNDFDVELLRQQQLKEQAKEMQLLSIMQSNVDKGSCCMIDDKILYKGDKIRGFEVRQISDSFVKLESEGLEIVLKLSE